MSAVAAVVAIGFLVGPIVSIVAVIDAAQRPAWAYQQVGYDKVVWVTLAATGIVFSWLGVGVAVAYLVGVRPKVAVAQQSPMLVSPPPPTPRPGPATVRRPADWLPDPTRRHELRWWDGTSWTEHVSDAGEPGRDGL